MTISLVQLVIVHTESFGRSGDQDDFVSDVFLRRRKDKVEDGPKYALVEFPDEEQELDEEGYS